MMSEDDFLKLPQSLLFKREPVLDSATMRVYVSADRMIGFDVHDKHLAWHYNRRTGKTDYRCNCIEKAQKMLGVEFQ